MKTRFSDSALEGLKWVALVAMTIDHVNTVIFDREHAWMFAVGRLAYPLFAFVLGVNLARPATDKGRAVRRLLQWAVIAQPVHAWAFGSMWPLNVLFAFAIAAAGLQLWQARRESLAVAVCLLAPCVVDYQWMGVACVLAAYAWAKSPNWNSVLACVGALASLSVVNGSFWQWAALPVLLAASGWTLYVPRLRWAFYGYYVAHFAVLALLATNLGQIFPAAIG